MSPTIFEELERACKVSSAEWNLEVRLWIARSNSGANTQVKIQEMMLVYSSEADIDRRCVSVMTRIVAAFIGLWPNRTISLRNMFGDRRELTVISVVASK